MLPVEMLSPPATVLEILETPPVRKRGWTFALHASFGMKEGISFNARLWSLQRREIRGSNETRAFHMTRDSLSNEDWHAWFVGYRRPHIVDSALNTIPSSVFLNRGSVIQVHTRIELEAPQSLRLVPLAIQVHSLANRSMGPSLPFKRIEGGYVYASEADGTPAYSHSEGPSNSDRKS